MKKSNNTKGNPYHDEDGKFTSSNGAREKNAIENGISFQSTSDEIKIDAGKITAEGIAKFLKNKKENASSYVPKTIEYAQKKGDEILGKQGSVIYSKFTDVEVANQYNEAIAIVKKDFSEIFSGATLMNYGTGVDLKKGEKFPIDLSKAYQEIFDIIKKSERFIKKASSIGVSVSDISNLYANNIYDLKNKFFNKELGEDVGGETSTGGATVKKFFESHNLTLPISVTRFNKSLSQSADKIEKYYNEGVYDYKCFLPSDKSAAYAIATHELGHFVHRHIENYMNENEKKMLSSALSSGYSQNGTWGKVSKIELALSKQISGYASKTKDEHIAEAISNHYSSNNPTKHNEAVFKCIMGIYKRIYGVKD